jgi:hypothetical protein
MEAIYLACGAGGPQLKRDPLDSTAQWLQPMLAASY